MSIMLASWSARITSFVQESSAHSLQGATCLRHPVSHFDRVVDSDALAAVPNLTCVLLRREHGCSQQDFHDLLPCCDTYTVSPVSVSVFCFCSTQISSRYAT